MDWTSLELKVISCNDLKAFNFFQKLSVYSVVSVVVHEQAKKHKEDNHQKHLRQRQKTSIDKGGRRNPEWNHEFRFDLQSLPPCEETDHLFIKFDLRHEGLVDRSIGEVRVPLKDLIDEFCGVVRFVSYQVRNSDGKPNGVLNFSYKLVGKKKINKKVDDVGPKAKGNATLQTTSFSEELVAYPKLELDNPSRDIIRYPSLDDIVYNINPPRPPRQFQCQSWTPAYYGTNSATLLGLEHGS